MSASDYFACGTCPGLREPEGQGFGGNLPGGWGRDVLEVAESPCPSGEAPSRDVVRAWRFRPGVSGEAPSRDARA